MYTEANIFCNELHLLSLIEKKKRRKMKPNKVQRKNTGKRRMGGEKTNFISFFIREMFAFRCKLRIRFVINSTFIKVESNIFLDERKNNNMFLFYICVR